MRIYVILFYLLTTIVAIQTIEKKLSRTHTSITSQSHTTIILISIINYEIFNQLIDIFNSSLNL